MIEQAAVLIGLAALMLAVFATCQAIANWSLRTPRSGYLILAVFVLYVIARN